MSNAFKRWLLCFGLWVLMLNPVSGQTGSRIVYGDGVREMLAMGRVGQYEFNGRSGDVVTVRLLRVSGSWDPAMEVFGADGRLLERQSGNRIQVDRTLSQDGLYSVLVSDVGADESGLYSLAVETLNGSAQFRKQVVDGSVVTDTLQFGGIWPGLVLKGFRGMW